MPIFRVCIRSDEHPFVCVDIEAESDEIEHDAIETALFEAGREHSDDGVMARWIDRTNWHVDTIEQQGP